MTAGIFDPQYVAQMEQLAEENGRAWVAERERRMKSEKEAADLRQYKREVEQAHSVLDSAAITTEGDLHTRLVKVCDLAEDASHVYDLVVAAHDKEIYELRHILSLIESILIDYLDVKQGSA